MKDLGHDGCDVRAVYDHEDAYRELPKDMAFDPEDSELAIYDDFRVDVFSGGKVGIINTVKCFSPAMRFFSVYLRQAVRYFDELWAIAHPIENFLKRIEEAIEDASARIDYESNWLAMYEFALPREDENLKTIELARVSEQLKDEERWGQVKRFLDVGTCTGRYIIHLRDAVKADGQIFGIDE